MGWPISSLRDHARIDYGLTAKAVFNIAGPKFLRITDIQDGFVDWGKVPSCNISDKDYQKHRLESGDIVFARTGATTGKSFLITKCENAVAASYLIRVRLKSSDLIPEFLYLFFSSASYWDTVDRGTIGSAQGGFNASKLSALRIPLPPIPEQKRIVAILDEAFEGIDKVVANTKKNLANARELFDSYLNNIYRKHSGDAVMWEEKALAEVCFVEKNRHKLDNISYVGLEDIESGTGRFIGSLRPRNAASATFTFTSDHILYGRLRPYLNKVLTPDFSGHCSSEIFPVKTYPCLEKKFLYYWLTQKSIVDKIDQTSTGARMPRANMAEVLNFNFFLPPLLEQKRIVAKLDVLRVETQRLEAIYQQKLTALTELKQSFLQRAFTGELTAEDKTTKIEAVA